MAYLAILAADETVAQVIVIPDDVADPVSYGTKLGLRGRLVPTGSKLGAIGEMHFEGKLYPIWRQPFGAGDDPLEAGTTGYPAGVEVFHAGKVWASLGAFNIWEPGVSGWRAAGAAPDWIQPTGAHDAYARGAAVTFGGKTWVSQLDGNVWAPGVYGWAVA